MGRKVTSFAPPPGFPVAVDAVYGCWIWQGLTDRDGYGRDDVGRVAHRAVFEALIGPVPDGRELDHLCRRRACVRPAHLEPVSRRENERRKSWRRRSARRRCAANHDLYTRGRRTPEGGKVCLTCAPVK